MHGGFFGGFGGSFSSNVNVNGPCGCCGPCCGECCCTGATGATGASVPVIVYSQDDDTPRERVVSEEKAFVLAMHPRHCMSYSGVQNGENPEDARLIEHNLADCDKGAKRYYSREHGGTVTLFFQHENGIAAKPPPGADDDIYYGVYFWNGNAADAHISILRQGASYGRLFANETLKQYLADQPVRVLTLPPNTGKWLFLGREMPELCPPEKGKAGFVARRELALPIGRYNSFEGMLKFTTDWPVHVQLEAWADFSKIRGTQLLLQPKEPQPGMTETTGYSPGTVGELRGEFRWRFNGRDPAPDAAGRRYLEVELPRSGDNRHRANAWTTHTTRRPMEINPVRRDILPYEVVTGVDPLEYTERNAESWRGLLANWGVVYREKLTFVNESCESQRVEYQFRVVYSHYITVWNSAGDVLDYHYNKYYAAHPAMECPNGIPNSRNFAAAKDNTITVAAVTVPPKTRRTIELAYVVGGRAKGGVEHRVLLGDRR